MPGGAILRPRGTGWWPGWVWLLIRAGVTSRFVFLVRLSRLVSGFVSLCGIVFGCSICK